MNDYVYTFIRQGQPLRKQYADTTLSGLDFMLTGGVYCLICIIYCFIGPGTLMTFLTVFLVSVWTLGKKFIQNAHLSDFETVREPTSRFKHWIKKLVVVLMMGLALYLWAFLILTGHINRWPSLLVISFMPFIILWYLHTPLDFVAGFYFWFLCAMDINGQPLGSTIQDLSAAFLMGVAPSFIGILLHLDYHRMVKKVKELRYDYRRSITHF